MRESCSPTVGLGAGVVDEAKTALDVDTAVMEVVCQYIIMDLIPPPP